MTTKPKPFTPSAATPITKEHVGWTAVHVAAGKLKIVSVEGHGDYPVTASNNIQYTADGRFWGGGEPRIVRVEPPGWKAKKRKPDQAKAKIGEVWRTPCGKTATCYDRGFSVVTPSGFHFLSSEPLAPGATRIAAAPKKGKK